MHPAALEYTARGWVSMPLHGKRPITPDWASLKATNPRDWPDNCNVGVVTGAVSGLVVLDVDPKHGGDASLEALEAQYGVIPGPRVQTGSGGTHIYMKHPGALVKVPCSVSKLGKGLDIRADGGQVVAPPSIHPETGGRYFWQKGGDLHAVPDWLLQRLGLQNARKCTHLRAKPKASKSDSEWARLIEEGVGEGNRNHTLASLTGYLLRHKLPLDVVQALLTLFNENRVKPPLDEEELNGVLSSISIRDAKNGER